ncbi:hypothetical protein LTR49_026896 [Elasticomyces elasticus]|nr:hypothetical protein LTR49_026896 [Elasticomyces elasticus]
MSEPVDVLMQGLAESVSRPPPPPPPPRPPPQAAQRGDAHIKFFDSGELSDFTILCGRYNFNVYKSIICAQSRYFRAPCGRDYAEGRRASIKLKAVGEGDSDSDSDLARDALEAIKLMVQYFYHLDYDAKSLELMPTPDRSDEPAEEPLAVAPVVDDFVHDPWSYGGLSSRKRKNWCKNCGRRGLEGNRLLDGTNTVALSQSTTEESKAWTVMW